MFEIIIIGIAVVLMIWACIFSWRLDNGASQDVENEDIKKEEKKEA